MKDLPDDKNKKGEDVFRSVFRADFKENTKIRTLPPRESYDESLINIQIVGHEYIGNNYYIKRQGYNSLLFTFVKKGSLNLIVNNHLYHIGKNHMIILNCMEKHTGCFDIDNKTDDCAEQFYLHLAPTPLLRYVYNELSVNGPIIDLREDFSEFSALCNDVIEAIDEGTFDETKTSVKIYETLLLLIKKARDCNREKTDVPDVVNETLMFISENYNKKINVEACAKNVFVSPNYLEHLFSVYAGIPIFTYIANIRFQKAIDLLLKSDLSVVEIARQVGFSDSQGLIRLFKNKTGMTPLSYRKHCRTTD